MNKALRRYISIIAILCLLAASLTGCGTSQVTEISVSATDSKQENNEEQGENRKHGDKPMEMPEMAVAEILEEDIKTLLQAGMEATAEESDLWAISEITDMEVLMQLMQGHGGRERPESENFDGEHPENMTPPDGERTVGEMPEGTMPEWDGENPPEGTFPEGEMPEGGQDRGEGGRQPGNRGGGMAGVALVVSSTEDAVVSKEDILSQIQLAAEELGLKVSSMELTEEQQSVIEVPDGHSVKMVVLISAQIREMNAGEAVG